MDVDQILDGVACSMPAFLTGSRAYGKPSDGSDVDLVVFVGDERSMTVLESLQERPAVEGNASGGAPVQGQSASLRFGRLNVIAVTDPAKYRAWLVGTRQLVDEYRRTGVAVERARAVALFKSLGV